MCEASAVSVGWLGSFIAGDEDKCFASILWQSRLLTPVDTSASFRTQSPVSRNLLPTHTRQRPRAFSKSATASRCEFPAPRSSTTGTPLLLLVCASPAVVQEFQSTRRPSSFCRTDNMKDGGLREPQNQPPLPHHAQFGVSCPKRFPMIGPVATDVRSVRWRRP